MREDPRRVLVTLGKKSYPLLTRLDEGRFERVLQIAKESVVGLDQSMEQDERLLLACFKLAYSIESAEIRMKELLGGVDLLDPGPGNGHSLRSSPGDLLR